MSGLVLGLVGTDHHRFDRFVDWVDAAAFVHPDVDFIIQHGTSRAPLVAEGRSYLPHAELIDLLRRADAVVCHGGPGTISDARAAGLVPVVLPRDPARGEHVDGHQLRFAALVGDAGLTATALTQADFEEKLSIALGRARRLPAPSSDGDETERARARLAVELDRLLVDRHRGPRPLRGSATR